MVYRNGVSPKRLRKILFYDSETGLFVWTTNRRGQKPPGTVAGTLAQDGYIKIRVDGVTYQAHRLAWLYMTGEWPPDEIDHKNLIKSDNRWSNLRPATHAQNMINVAGRKDGLKGAYFDPKRRRWFSQIRVNKRQVRLGTFKSENEAHNAYAEAAKKYHGQFARLT